MQKYRGNNFFLSINILIVLVVLLVFQPNTWTFSALRPSDLWLLLSASVQFKTRRPSRIYFNCRKTIFYYGICIGGLAFLSTLIQHHHSGTTPRVDSLFIIYRFLRFTLIYYVVENILLNSSTKQILQFLQAISLIGLVTLLFAYFEHNLVEPIYSLINQLYDSRLTDGVILIEQISLRTRGVFSNPNLSAIFLASGVMYSLVSILKRYKSVSVVYHTIFVFASIYGFLVLFGSRTALFSIIIAFTVLFIIDAQTSKNRFKIIIYTLVLFTFGFIYSSYVVQEHETHRRIGESIEGLLELKLNRKEIGSWVGRGWLWEERLSEFRVNGNDFKHIIGIGFTKEFADYADNGFLSAYLFTGIIGLFLKLNLVWCFLKLFFAKWRKLIPKNNNDELIFDVFGLIVFVLLLGELTIDLIQNYKLGQLFFLFLSIFVVNANKLLQDRVC